jgi:EREBP-like factor
MAGKGGKGLLTAKMTAAKTPYALNGVSECLKMGLASAGVGVTVRDQLSGLREACRKKQQHEGVQLQQLERELAAETADDAKAGQEACSGSSGATEVAREFSLSEASGIEDGDVLWSSQDLSYTNCRVIRI